MHILYRFYFKVDLHLRLVVTTFITIFIQHESSYNMFHSKSNVNLCIVTVHVVFVHEVGIGG